MRSIEFYGAEDPKDTVAWNRSADASQMEVNGLDLEAAEILQITSEPYLSYLYYSIC